MIRFIFSCLVFSMLVACNEQGPADETLLDVNPPAFKKETGVRELQRITTTREFSEKGSDDTFVIYLFGDSTATSDATFLIIQADGDTIYKMEFPAIDLAGDRSTEDPRPVDKHIKDRMKKFFAHDQFVQVDPAKHPWDELTISKAAYDEIMSDRDRLAFLYLLGYEDGRAIAYLPSQKKVVMFFNCC